MFHLHSCTLKWEGKSINVPLGKKTFLDEAYLDFTRTAGKHGVRYQLYIHPKRDIVLDEVKVLFHEPFEADAQVLCNGYQSWSESQEQELRAVPKNMRWPGKKFFKYYGDEHLALVSQGAAPLRSWTYGYVREADQLRFIGSLKENSGFTLIEYLPSAKQVRARVDCSGFLMQHSFPVIDLWVAEGKDQAVFDEYFSNMPFAKPSASKDLGWCSWYQHYREINEKIVLKNLKSIVKHKLPYDYMQIDDGYQTATGDWLSVDKEKFPNGMRSVARAIRDKGMQPGIWIAPFVCSKDSKIFRQHPEWLIKNSKGQPEKIGYNPLWGGWYYALNFYDNQFQQHLIGVLITLTEKWNYSLIKMDFLFAAAICPPANKTPGQVMNEVMEFLRHTVGNKKILACGVPLGAALGKVDYCRVGADIHLQWEHKLLHWLRKKERVSCRAAMRSIFARWHLNQRAFGNDPDVFILREAGNKLTESQRLSITMANALLGDLVFTSDDANQWSKEQIKVVKNLKKYIEVNPFAVSQVEQDRYRIDFEMDGAVQFALFNFQNKTWQYASADAAQQLAPYEHLIQQV